jgi:hypothetical protein
MLALRSVEGPAANAQGLLSGSRDACSADCGGFELAKVGGGGGSNAMIRPWLVEHATQCLAPPAPSGRCRTRDCDLPTMPCTGSHGTGPHPGQLGPYLWRELCHRAPWRQKPHRPVTLPGLPPDRLPFLPVSRNVVMDRIGPGVAPHLSEIKPLGNRGWLFISRAGASYYVSSGYVAFWNTGTEYRKVLRP